MIRATARATALRSASARVGLLPSAAIIALSLASATSVRAEPDKRAAAAAYAEGLASYRKGDYLAAARHFERSLAAAAHPDTRYALAQAYRGAYRQGGKIAFARKAIALYREVLSGPGRARWKRKATQHLAALSAALASHVASSQPAAASRPAPQRYGIAVLPPVVRGLTRSAASDETLALLGAHLATRLARKKIAGSTTDVLAPAGQPKALAELCASGGPDCRDALRRYRMRRWLIVDLVYTAERCAIVITSHSVERSGSAVDSEPAGCDRRGFFHAVNRVTPRILHRLSRGSSSGGEGVLLVDSRPSRAGVVLDGRSLEGKTPLLLSRVAAGTHRLELRKGARSFRSPVEIEPGRLTTLAPRLIRAFEPKLSLGARRALRSMAARERKTIWAATAGAVAGACLTAMAVLYGIGFSQKSAALDEYRAATEQQQMDAAWSDVQSSYAMTVAGHLLLGAGAAALAVTVYQLLTRPPAGGERSALRLQPRAAGASLVWRFTSSGAGP